MSVKKKVGNKIKENTPSNVQLAFHNKWEIGRARNKLQKHKKLERTIDPTLANAAKQPGRPYVCLYPSTKRYPLEMPEIVHAFLKNKSKNEGIPIRQIILELVMDKYGDEIAPDED